MYNVTGGAGYPMPDSYTGVTFSGGVLWYQGFIGDKVARIISSNLSKKPIDPLFNYEYTYSLLGNKREYQIKGNLESGKIGHNNNLIDISTTFHSSLGGSVILNSIQNLLNNDYKNFQTANAASTGATTCYINGNYNGLLDSTKDSSNTNYILAVPSLILTDPTNGANTTFTGGNLSRMGSGILQCNGQNDPCVINYNSSNIIYTGTPTTTSQVTTIAQNLQQAYSDSSITSLPIISNLLSATGQTLTDLGLGLVKNTVGIQTLTLPDTNTSILFHFDGDFNNYGTNLGGITNNGGVSFTGGKFGQAAFFNGSSSYLTIPDSSDLDIGNNDFTIELWIKTLSVQQDYIFAKTIGNYIDYGMDIGGNTAGKIRFLASDINDNSYQILAESSNKINDGLRHHIAGVRNGSIFYLFIDGIIRGTDNTATCNINNSSQPLSIGKDLYLPEQSRFVQGSIDEFRISKGVSRWTSNFIPLAQPY